MHFANQLRPCWDAPPTDPSPEPFLNPQNQVTAGRTGTPGTKAPLRNLGRPGNVQELPGASQGQE